MIIIYIQPSDFALEKTTIWSFKERGDWATHSGEYIEEIGHRMYREILFYVTQNQVNGY